MSNYTKDVIERSVRAFIAGVFTAVAANLSGVTEWSSGRAFALSAATAGFSALLSFLAKAFGNPDSASFIDGEQ